MKSRQLMFMPLSTFQPRLHFTSPCLIPPPMGCNLLMSQTTFQVGKGGSPCPPTSATHQGSSRSEHQGVLQLSQCRCAMQECNVSQRLLSNQIQDEAQHITLSSGLDE